MDTFGEIRHTGNKTNEKIDVPKKYIHINKAWLYCSSKTILSFIDQNPSTLSQIL